MSNPPENLVIRAIERGELDAVVDIYNHYIRNTVITFDIDDLTLADWQHKFDQISMRNFPFLVALVGDQIVGFAYVASWRQKAAYDQTVENTMYLRPEFVGKGIGPKLLQELLEQSKAAGIKQVVAVISDQEADASIALHERFGFTNRGHLENVGHKFDRSLGVHMLQKAL